MSVTTKKKWRFGDFLGPRTRRHEDSCVCLLLVPMTVGLPVGVLRLATGGKMCFGDSPNRRLAEGFDFVVRGSGVPDSRTAQGENVTPVKHYKNQTAL